MSLNDNLITDISHDLKNILAFVRLNELIESIKIIPKFIKEIMNDIIVDAGNIFSEKFINKLTIINSQSASQDNLDINESIALNITNDTNSMMSLSGNSVLIGEEIEVTSDIENECVDKLGLNESIANQLVNNITFEKNYNKINLNPSNLRSLEGFTYYDCNFTNLFPYNLINEPKQYEQEIKYLPKFINSIAKEIYVEAELEIINRINKAKSKLIEVINNYDRQKIKSFERYHSDWKKWERDDGMKLEILKAILMKFEELYMQHCDNKEIINRIIDRIMKFDCEKFRVFKRTYQNYEDWKEGYYNAIEVEDVVDEFEREYEESLNQVKEINCTTRVASEQECSVKNKVKKSKRKKSKNQVNSIPPVIINNDKTLPREKITNIDLVKYEEIWIDDLNLKVGKNTYINREFLSKLEECWVSKDYYMIKCLCAYKKNKGQLNSNIQSPNRKEFQTFEKELDKYISEINPSQWDRLCNIFKAFSIREDKIIVIMNRGMVEVYNNKDDTDMEIIYLTYGNSIYDKAKILRTVKNMN
ncbi:unnamed protein product [Rotaria socialis]|uniref:Uncharacterized protein n=1 Tax=Rotaria socialis TaxID=392032 RepID=A0A821W4D8_9BILA|nr:unnamed protein product [Rotaria socialis]CAF4916776.1 unnamed protein product [Rotaria socialis]